MAESDAKLLQPVFSLMLSRVQLYEEKSDLSSVKFSLVSVTGLRSD